MNKPSVSGLMSNDHEINRFENLFYKPVKSAYYFKEWGLDWSLFLSQGFDVPLTSFLSYVRQEATKQGIIIESINGTISDFTLTTTVKINGIEQDINRGLF